MLVGHARRAALAIAGASAIVVLGGSLMAEAAATAPPGYTVVTQTFTAVPGLFDSGGQTSCSSGSVLWGGGVAIGYEQPNTIETSAPSGTTAWQARVNDGLTTNTNFQNYAICATKPIGYKIVYHTVSNLGVLATATAVCPTGTVVFGGGQLSTSDQTNVRMYSSWPVSQTKYRARMFGSGMDDKLTVYAICGQKPAGYVIVRHKFADPTGTTDIGGAVCPANTSVIGGGINSVPLANGEVPLIWVSESYPEGQAEWGTADTNTNSYTVTVVSSAICAA